MLKSFWNRLKAIFTFKASITSIPCQEDLIKKALTNYKVIDQDIRRAKLLSSLMQEALIIIKSGLILDVNQGFCDIFKYSEKQDILNRPLLNVFDEKEIKTLTRGLRFNKEEDHIISGHTKDNKQILVKAKIVQTIYEGQVLRIITCLRVEKAQKFEKLFNLLADRHDETLLITDEDSIITYVNKKASKFLEYEHTEIINSSLFDFIDLASYEKFRDCSTGRGCYSLKFTTRFGDSKLVSVQTLPINCKGNYLGSMIFIEELVNEK